MPDILIVSALATVAAFAVFMATNGETLGRVVGSLLGLLGLVLAVVHYSGLDSSGAPAITAHQRTAAITAARQAAKFDGLKLVGNPWFDGRFVVSRALDPGFGAACFSASGPISAEWTSPNLNQSPCKGH